MDNKWSLFQKFLISQDVEITLTDLALNSVIVIILSIFLEYTYMKCGRTFSNRKMFAQNFYLIAFTTMLIISIVKSSLALSLGLVGALSIVRFRAAIKEPEELSYLFLAIAIGLGLGANQRVIVPSAFAIIMSVIWIKYFFFGLRHKGQNLFLTIRMKSDKEDGASQVWEIVNKIFKKSELRRYDQNDAGTEVTFQVESQNIKELESCKNEFSKLGEGVNITYINSDA